MIFFFVSLVDIWNYLLFQINRNENFSDSNNQVALQDINVRNEAKAYLGLEFSVGTIGKEHIDGFCCNCLEFYVTASHEIRNRLPFDEEFWSCVSTFRVQLAVLLIHFARDMYNVYISMIWHLCHIFLWTITFKNTQLHSAKIIASRLFTSVNMSSFVPSESHLRHSLLFLFHQKKKAAEAHRLLVETYGEHTPVIRTCETW